MSPFSSSVCRDTNSHGVPGGWASRLVRGFAQPKGRLCATRSSWAEPGRYFFVRHEPAAELEAALPLCRLVHSPWEAHSGYQSCSSSVLTVSTSTMKGLGHIVRGSWGLEVSVAARVTYILLGWVRCPWLGENGFFTLVWEKIDSNLNREVMGTKDKLLHCTCPSPIGVW